MRIARIAALSILLAAVAAARAEDGNVSLAVPADEKIGAVVEKAPDCPYLDKKLRARLVDFLDCATPADEEPHPLLGDSHHRVRRSDTAGAYR